MDRQAAVQTVLSVIKTLDIISDDKPDESIIGSDLCNDHQLDWGHLQLINTELEHRLDIDMGEGVDRQQVTTFDQFVELVLAGSGE